MEENKELMFKLSLFEQQMQQIQQQLQAIEQALVEMERLNLDLDDFSGAKGKEILAPISKGIFVNTKIMSEELTVDIGNKNFVKKNIPETKKIIEGQIKKLKEIKIELNNNLGKMNEEFTKMILESQKK